MNRTGIPAALLITLIFASNSGCGLAGGYDFEGYVLKTGSGGSSGGAGGGSGGEPECSLAMRVGGEGFDRAYNVAGDADGNFYVTGFFADEIRFGDATYKSAGRADIFLASFARDGSPRWSRTFGGYGTDWAHDVVIDPNGDILLFGEFGGEAPGGDIDFGGGPLVAKGSSDLFLASFAASNGAHRWSRAWGGAGTDEGDKIIIKKNGDLIAVGEFHDTVDLGITTLTSKGGYDMFVLTLTSTGDVLEAASFGGSGHDAAFSAAFGSEGNLLLAGYFADKGSDSVDFGGGPISSGPDVGDGHDLFVASLAPSGAGGWLHQWSIGVGATGVDDAASDVAVDSSGNVFVTGVFGGPVQLGPEMVSWSGGLDGLLFSVSSSGTLRWWKRFGGPGDDKAGTMTFDPSGNLVTVGSYAGPVEIGGETLPTSDGEGALVMSHSTGGVFRWARGYPSTGHVLGFSVDWVEPCAVISGHFSGTMTVDDEILEATPGGDSLTNLDGYVVRLRP